MRYSTHEQQSVKLLESIAYAGGIVAGDTRFDRVIARTSSETVSGVLGLG